MKQRQNAVTDVEELLDILLGPSMVDAYRKNKFKTVLKKLGEKTKEATELSTQKAEFTEAPTNKLQGQIKNAIEMVLVRQLEHIKNRRTFIKNLATLISGTTLTVGGLGYEATDNYRYPKYTIAHPEIPPEFDGLTIVLLADLHLYDNELLSGYGEQEIRDTQAYIYSYMQEHNVPKEKQFTLVPGDIGNKSGGVTSREYLARIIPLLSEFPGTKLFTLGNHDTHERSHTDDIIGNMQEAGYQFIGNPGANIFEMKIGGKKLSAMGTPSFIGQSELVTPALGAQAEEMSEQSDFFFLVNHNADLSDPFIGNLKNTLQVSGHVHKGHIGLPLFQQAALYHLEYASDKIHGKYLEEGASNVATVVTAGAGNGPAIPLRLNAPPELPIITLKHIPNN